MDVMVKPFRSIGSQAPAARWPVTDGVFAVWSCRQGEVGPGSEYEVSVEMVQEKTADLLKNVRQPPAPNTRNPGLRNPRHI